MLQNRWYSRWSDQGKPLIIAHRGASHDAPENTIVAFTLARTMGADGVELDTSLSKDGIPVVIHDLSLDKTTNGHGPVNRLTLAELQQLDASHRFQASHGGVQIPTLADVLAACGPDLFVNIELKSLPPNDRDGLEAAVLRVIRAANAEERVIISSFNPFALRRFHALAPEIPIGYLYAPGEPLPLRYGWFMFGLEHEARHPYHQMIDANYMRWAKTNRYRVNTWTVDDPERIKALAALGVDAVITNRPDVALQAVGR